MSLKKVEVSTLTEKHKLFVREYLKDFNGTRAYKEVYKCADDTARINASKLLTKSNIQDAIRKQADKRLNKVEIGVEDVLNELKSIAFADRTKISSLQQYEEYNEETGETRTRRNLYFATTDDLDDDTKKVIASYKYTQSGISVETYDKMKALELLGKYLGIFKENVDVNVSTNQKFDEICGQIGGEGLDE